MPNLLPHASAILQQAIQDEERRKFREFKELEKQKKQEELQKKTGENILREHAILEERQKVLDQKERERLEVENHRKFKQILINL